jgi:anti-anti-sigma factor
MMSIYPASLKTALIAATPSSGVMLLRVTGDVDEFSTLDFSLALRKALVDPAEQVELDLSDVTFFCSAGVDALLAAHGHAGGRLRLIAASRCVRRLLQILEIESRFAMRGNDGIPATAVAPGRLTA